jgi:hypothetical protein
MTDTPLNTAREYLAQFGVTPRVVSEKNHVKVRFEYMGAKLQFTVSKTPSDRRVHLKVRSQLRRMMRTA